MFHYTKITYKAPNENKMENEMKHDLASFEALLFDLADLKQKLGECSKIKYLHSLVVKAKPFLNDFDRGQLFATLKQELRTAEDAVFQAQIHLSRILDDAKGET